MFTARQRDQLLGCCGCIVVVPIVAALMTLISCGGMLGFVARHGADVPARFDERDRPAEPVRKIVERETPAKAVPTADPIVEPPAPGAPQPTAAPPPSVEPTPAATAVARPAVTSPAAALAKIRAAERELREQKAQSKLRVAKSFLRLKNVPAAIAELEAVLCEFADTAAAVEARKVLRVQSAK